MIFDPLMWLAEMFGAKKQGQPGADFGKDAQEEQDRIPHYGILTPQRQEFYERAMLETKSPQAFRELADDFEKVGLKEEAKQLRARGDSRAAGLDIHEKRRVIVGQCMDSEDPLTCEEGADICEQLGMTVAAKELRAFATGLRERAELALKNQPPAPAIEAGAPPPAQLAIPNEGPGPIVAVPAAAPVEAHGPPADMGVWANEDDRAKGWSTEDAFERHSEK